MGFFISLVVGLVMYVVRCYFFICFVRSSSRYFFAPLCISLVMYFFMYLCVSYVFVCYLFVVR